MAHDKGERADELPRSERLPAGLVYNCDVWGCASPAGWVQVVHVSPTYEQVWLVLCAYHSFALHGGDASDPVLAQHYRCLECGATVEPADTVTLTLEDGRRVYEARYRCAGDCAQEWDGQELFEEARDRLRAEGQADAEEADGPSGTHG